MKIKESLLLALLAAFAVCACTKEPNDLDKKPEEIVPYHGNGEDKDKDEFYITFKTQGEFEIMPTVYNAATGIPVYYPNWDYNSSMVNVSGDDIFTTAPHIDTTTRELLGKLSTNQGTAVIDIEIKVKVSTSPEVWQVYPRRIYIIRKN